MSGTADDTALDPNDPSVDPNALAAQQAAQSQAQAAQVGTGMTPAQMMQMSRVYAALGDGAASASMLKLVQGAAPSGYALGADGSFHYMPGGPNDPAVVQRQASAGALGKQQVDVPYALYQHQQTNAMDLAQHGAEATQGVAADYAKGLNAANLARQVPQMINGQWRTPAQMSGDVPPPAAYMPGGVGGNLVPQPVGAPQQTGNAGFSGAMTALGSPSVDVNASRFVPVMLAQNHMESGSDPNAGSNPLSSASGIAQITTGTYLPAFRAAFPQANVNDAQALALRSNPDVASTVALKIHEDNAQALSQAGTPVNPGTLGMAYRFGPDGAQHLLAAGPNALVSSVLPQTIAANPDLRGKTVGQMLDYYQNGLSNRMAMVRGPGGMNGLAYAAGMTPDAARQVGAGAPPQQGGPGSPPPAQPSPMQAPMQAPAMPPGGQQLPGAAPVAFRQGPSPSTLAPSPAGGGVPAAAPGPATGTQASAAGQAQPASAVPVWARPASVGRTFDDMQAGSRQMVSMNGGNPMWRYPDGGIGTDPAYDAQQKEYATDQAQVRGELNNIPMLTANIGRANQSNYLLANNATGSGTGLATTVGGYFSGLAQKSGMSAQDANDMTKRLFGVNPGDVDEIGKLSSQMASAGMAGLTDRGGIKMFQLLMSTQSPNGTMNNAASRYIANAKGISDYLSLSQAQQRASIVNGSWSDYASGAANSYGGLAKAGGNVVVPPGAVQTAAAGALSGAPPSVWQRGLSPQQVVDSMRLAYEVNPQATLAVNINGQIRQAPRPAAFGAPLIPQH